LVRPFWWYYSSRLSDAAEVPVRDQARAVIVGGGVAGASIAYHLARLGWTELVLVEQHELTEGTSWHSAGFVGQLRAGISQTRMIMYSAGLYPELAGRTGLDPGWHAVGGLRLAGTPARVEELRRQTSAAATYGLAMDLLTPAEAHRVLPLLDVTGVRAAGWLPGDGYLRPEPLTRALAAGATGLGVEIATGTRVTGVRTVRGRIAGVHTTHGEIRTEVLVNAAGAAAGWLGELAGAAVPVVPMKHQYVVSAPLPGPASEVAGLATVRDPDHLVYLRGDESGGLLVGGYVRQPEVGWPAAGPALAEPRALFPPAPQRYADWWASARRRVPALGDAPVARVVHGIEAFTPDGEFLLGETEVAGFWVAAGFCVHGLAAAGGVGKALAEWIVDGTPEYDMSTMDIRRFGGHAASRSWATARALDAYSTYYDIGYPHQERATARPLRRSATWPRLAALGAELGEKAGWERVNWFAANEPGPGSGSGRDSGARLDAAGDGAAGDGAADDGGAGDGPAGVHAGRAGVRGGRPRGWAGRVWSPAIEAECQAAAEAAALFDQSSFAKFTVAGPAAAGYLSWLCAGDVDRAPGTVSYTQLLNRRAGIEADLTVTRLAEDRFRLVTSTGSGARDLAWLRRHAPAGVVIEDVTGGYGCLCLWGPAARDILQPLTDTSLAGADFRFMRAVRLCVGPVPVLAQRVTYVGELGWELYPATEYTLTLWDLLLATGRRSGLRPAGYRAIDAMRLEKGYRVWGSDITPETTPDEAGLDFAVRVDKPFLGRDALLTARATGAPRRRLRCLLLADPGAVCLGTEPVRVDGAPVGRVTSGGYGYRIGASIGYAYLPAELPIGTTVEVGVFGEWLPATVVPDSPYDPTHARVRNS
jgi:4-methylaminobutanoate oxidase (formaldehyde-forming)